ncbi:MAG: hypothetical protein HQK75_04635 [Candidatus Magnetomorum sp.]|nr:hypothetical protein [Candidatus Magnetomorum sp.]
MRLLIILFIVLLNGFVFAEDLTSQAVKLNIVERLARLEEGQKSMDRQLEEGQKSMDRRFEAVDQRFESVLREMNQRFDSMMREIIQRFEAADNRFELMEKRMDQLENYFMAMIAAFFTLIGFILWDRKTAFEKAFERAFEKVNEKFENERIKTEELILSYTEQDHQSLSNSHKQKSNSSPHLNEQKNQEMSIKEKLNQIMAVMTKMSKQNPELRTLMHDAQLI